MNEPDKSLFEEIIDSLVVVNKEGIIKEINQAAVNLLGYKSKEEIVGKPMATICPNFPLKKIINKLPLSNYEMVYLDKQKKEIAVSVNITGHRDSQGMVEDIILVARDMTEIKQLISELTGSREELTRSYEELRDRKGELVHSEKLAFTGRIAASIAHEIRNPLSNVSMSVGQLKKGIRSKSGRDKHIDIIEKNTERINYLITELLNSARPPKLDMRSHNIHRLLESVLQATKSKTKSQRIKVVKEFKAKRFMISVDEEHMKRAFLNLINNAIEAMPRGGRLRITSGQDENVLLVKIEDTGKGIREGDIISIFEPFFSTRTDGIGLGLTICYGIIVSHGGTVEVESKPRKGSVFTVSLPLGEEAGVQARRIGR